MLGMVSGALGRRQAEPAQGRRLGMYNPAAAAAVLELVAEGISLRGACDRLGLARRTVRGWAATVPEFTVALRSARREGFEVWADEILSIGDEVAGCTDTAQVQAARVRIDSRKWLLAKLHPEQYGDHIQLTGRGDRDLIPVTAPETAVPRLMSVLTVLLPGASNSELHNLASAMVEKVNSAGNGPSPSLTFDPGDDDDTKN
jgi:hypothetical protein